MLRLSCVVAVMLVAAGSILAAPARAQADSPVTLAAAASLRPALEEILRAFTADTGIEPRVSYGSSGNLTRQIEQGAPFELFLSADEGFAARLVETGHGRSPPVVYAYGRLALFVPDGSPVVPDANLDGLAAALTAEPRLRFAIAHPELAPYGRAAREVLEARGLWDRVSARLVVGEDVAQAAQFASGGGAAGGLIAWSLARTPGLAARGRAVLLPKALHAPLPQAMVLTRRASPEARRLFAYLQSAPARAALHRHGFEPPGD
jgi:molybdate transport system substrate-binding protein